MNRNSASDTVDRASQRTAQLAAARQASATHRGDQANAALTHAKAAVTRARIALERGEYGSATRLLRPPPTVELLAADVLRGDIFVRTGVYDDHYDLVFRLARSYPLSGRERAALAVQTGELAVLAANEQLAVGLFAFAMEGAAGDALLTARAFVGCAIAGLVSGALSACGCGSSDAADSVTPGDVLSEVAAHLNPTVDPNAVGLTRIADTLDRVGLIDLGRRIRIVASAWMTGIVDPAIDPLAIARCPWVTSATLHRRLVRCSAEEFDYWATAMELRLADGPHPSLVNEAADVIRWAPQIHDQSEANVQLACDVKQAQEGWQEVANLTSNEIRGVLTSLEVVTDLRRVGAKPPPGLERALVHRIAALTTMTQLGATASPNRAEWPVQPATPAAALVSDIVDGARPMFDWTDRTLAVDIAVDDTVTFDVHPRLFADMVRWLLISATTGSLRDASIEIRATIVDRRLRLTIVSRTPEAPMPEPDRELGLGPESTAHRAAVAILDSWGGRFSAVYSVAGLTVTIDLPTADADPA